MGLKILCSADWHLDAPLNSHPELREAQLEIPGKLLSLCREERCDMVLLPGDLFDGAYSGESLRRFCAALAQMQVPVFIAPGNHDFYGEKSLYLREILPENVTVFQKPAMTAVYLPELGCTVYGAGYSSMDAPAMLRGFHAKGPGLHIGLLHGDPLNGDSPCCPIRETELEASGLHLLALGHIHKSGKLSAGKTLCLWPGSPMGRDFGECGEKGAWIVELSAEAALTRFVPLGLPCFFEKIVDAKRVVIPEADDPNYYRITVTGRGQLPMLPNSPRVTWLDTTLPELDVWAAAEEDSLEGAFFRLLREKALSGNRDAQLAAELSRRILDGEEILPC